MAMLQTKLRPIDLQVSGEPNTGEVWIHYRTGEDTVFSVQLSPKILGETILNLVLCAASSQSQEVLEVIQPLATRELHARVIQGQMVGLFQELECGLTMTLAIDVADAAKLHLELQNTLNELSSSGPSAQH